ncbi:hypothetical protein VNO77_44410 [Canavalia gladiata]|uniref:Uncharacterized protein n=1 Tax=Canavalia gladiata TaxID=3824 RepID=A0AAN9PQR3_CANGL
MRSCLSGWTLALEDPDWDASANKLYSSVGTLALGTKNKTTLLIGKFRVLTERKHRKKIETSEQIKGRIRCPNLSNLGKASPEALAVFGFPSLDLKAENPIKLAKINLKKQKIAFNIQTRILLAYDECTHSTRHYDL